MRHLLTLSIVCMISIEVLIMGTSIVYAKESIDLNRYSSCSIDGYCKTEVDINELDLSKDGKDLLKSIDSKTSYSIETSHSIDGFSIDIIDKEKLLITGHIMQNTYWTADLGEVLLDPWWNVTTNVSTNTTFTSIALSSGGTNNDDYNRRGILFTIDNDTTKLYVKRHDDSTSSFAWLVFAGNKSSYQNATYTASDYAVFNNTPAGSYYILNNITTGSGEMFQNDAASYPYASDIIHAVVGAIWRGNGAWNNYTTYYFEIEKVIATTENDGTVATWYENHLYLNGTEGNVSFNTTDTINFTGTTNLTGATVLIYINDTLSANSTDSATNETNLTAGLYNITGWFGNISTNESITWWATVSEYVPPANLTGSYYKFCSDNNTLSYYNEYNFQTDTLINRSSYCENGCDNITMSCNLPQYQQNLIIVVIFIVVGIIGYLIVRRL